MDKIVEDEKGLKEFEAKKKVENIGDGAHILLPKILRGKIVSVNYKRRGKK